MNPLGEANGRSAIRVLALLAQRLDSHGLARLYVSRDRELSQLRAVAECALQGRDLDLYGCKSQGCGWRGLFLARGELGGDEPPQRCARCGSLHVQSLDDPFA